MGPVKIIAIAALLISFFISAAFFGRLPALRNTPVGSLYRFIWIHIPNGLDKVDRRVTGGRISTSAKRLAHTLWNDKHPLVMIFFILLLSVSEILFLPPAWPLMSMQRRIIGLHLLIGPYILLYLAAYTDPGYISAENHYHAMSLYPYDFALYYPGNGCRTCNFLKPARSKHCSICKRCISRLDHHCIFINNCVGYNNIHWFLLLLLSTATLISYAAYVGFSILSAEILKNLASWTITGKGYSWSEYFNVWGWAMQEYTRIGAVTLLCMLTAPLIWGLLGYHLYLIWAGTTTNESMKWGDWTYEMGDGFAFKRRIPRRRIKDFKVETETSWPVESEQVLVRTVDGKPPTERQNREIVGVGEWERVWRLKDVENLYDLGFWDNLKDVLFKRHIE